MAGDITASTSAATPGCSTAHASGNAAHAQPTGIRKGTLFVTVDSSVWLDEIVRYRRREILERLQHSFGRELVARISFRVG